MGYFGVLKSASGATVITLTLRHVFEYEYRQRRSVFWICLCAAAAIQTALYYLALRGGVAADLLQELFVLVCASVFPYTLLQPERKRTFLLFGLAYCATCDYIVFLLPVNWPDAAYLLLDVLCILFALYMSRSREKTVIPNFLDNIPVWIYFAVFAADLSAFYSGMLDHDATYFTNVSLALRIGSFILIVVSVVFASRRYFFVWRAEQAMAEQLSVQLKHYEDLVEKNRRIRAFRHDYANNLLSIGAILDAGQTEDAKAYVRKLQEEVQSAAYAYTTGNYLADAILSDKAAQAQSQEIRISFDGTVPETGVTNPDLCTILCNFLDNAIRGCADCTPCTVELTGRETEDRWRLIVCNPVPTIVTIRNNTVKTTKEDGENHGLGLANVRRAAEKYNGYIELKCDDCRFTAEVGLILHREEKE